MCHSNDCIRVGLLSDIPLVLGSLCGLLSVSVHTNSQSLVEICSLLRTYAAREHFNESWLGSNEKNLTCILLVWLVANIERIRASAMVEALLDGSLDLASALYIISFAVSSLFLMALVFCMLYICSALLGAVDSFCVLTVSDQNLERSVPRWNVVQAVLRRVSERVQACLFVLQSAIVLTFMLAACDVYRSMQADEGYVALLIPGGLLVLGMSSVFFKAAAVTDKCARVPSLLNSSWFGKDHTERQYVVEYVLYSDAGFYVFDIRLTSAMTLKFAYICVLGLFSLLTQIVADL